MISMTRPTGMTLQQWADRVVLDLDAYGPLQKLKDTNWQRWAVQLPAIISLGYIAIPNPYQFTDWKLWAEYVCGELA